MAKDCAILMEENYNYEQAIIMYVKAAKLYEMEKQTTQSYQLTAKSLELKIVSKQWVELPDIIN